MPRCVVTGFVLALFALAGPASAQCAAGGTPTGKTCAQAEATYQGCCSGPSELHWCENGFECVKNCAGNPSNSCCAYSAKGGCCDTQWMQLVCSQKPECCTTSWNGSCIAIAMVLYDMPCPQNENTPCGEATYNLCGWDANKLFYNCAPSTSGDPGGTYARDCALCTPTCVGKQCGPDGCGGTCGSCGATGACTDQGQCVAVCQSDCVGKQCGPNGCGGSCGSCSGTLVCDAAAQCVPQATCSPSCFGKACGPDGCGGTCGACGFGSTCTANGACAVVDPGCTPSCSGKACGPDGCGGTCGSCDAWESCSAEQTCVPLACSPDCAGRDCGDDGCGGTCGGCDSWERCNDSGKCELETAPCVAACGGRACGDDGCGGSCGACSREATCNSAGVCIPDSQIPIVTCPPGETPDYDGSCKPIPPPSSGRASGCSSQNAPGRRGAVGLTGASLAITGLLLGLRRRRASAD